MSAMSSTEGRRRGDESTAGRRRFVRRVQAGMILVTAALMFAAAWYLRPVPVERANTEAPAEPAETALPDIRPEEPWPLSVQIAGSGTTSRILESNADLATTGTWMPKLRLFESSPDRYVFMSAAADEALVCISDGPEEACVTMGALRAWVSGKE